METNAETEIVYGTQALARKVNGAWYYYIYNAHGDVIGLTDDNGNVVNSYEYDAWGNVLSKTEAIENPIRYAGQYFDEELGMYYLRARYYDATIGRFTSVDKIEGNTQNPLDMNQYVYCRDNPVCYVDLTGQVAITASAGAALLYKAAPYIVAGVTAAVGVGIMYYKEHTKGARGSTYDKHTKKRSGAPSKASKKPGWQDRSNKNKSR